MDYLFLVASLLIGIHSYTFARYLGAKENKLGMFGVLFLIMINLSLSIYEIII